MVGAEGIILLYCQKDSILFLFYFLKKGDKPIALLKVHTDLLLKLKFFFF